MPITPPPMTASRRGGCCQRSASTWVTACSMPGIGGRGGRRPVAITMFPALSRSPPACTVCASSTRSLVRSTRCARARSGARVWDRTAPHDPLGTRHRGRPVDSQIAGAGDAELAQPARQDEELSDPDQGLFRDSAVMQSGAAQEIILLDHRNPAVQFQRRLRRRPAPGSPADHHQVKTNGPACSSSPQLARHLLPWPPYLMLAAAAAGPAEAIAACADCGAGVCTGHARVAPRRLTRTALINRTVRAGPPTRIIRCGLCQQAQHAADGHAPAGLQQKAGP
jgi:hypothetical protein